MRIIAYIADWSFSADLTIAEAGCLTHIHYAFGLIKDGCVSVSHLGNLPRFLRIKEQFPHLKVLLSIGGWGAGGFSEAVATSEGREKLASSAADLVTELSLDGIDWDWEYPTSSAAGITSSPEDAANMTLLLCLMRRKLDRLSSELGRPLEQSIAVGADRTQDYLWQDALPALDAVGLMTYDMVTAGKACHAANLYPSPMASYSADSSVKAFSSAGVPPEKLLIGAAFYYHAYNAPTPGSDYACKEKNCGFSDLPQERTFLFDEVACAGFYRCGGLLFSGDDPRSLAEKRRYILENRLGGIIIWELNHDREMKLLPYLSN